MLGFFVIFITNVYFMSLLNKTSSLKSTQTPKVLKSSPTGSLLNTSSGFSTPENQLNTTPKSTSFLLVKSSTFTPKINNSLNTRLQAASSRNKIQTKSPPPSTPVIIGSFSNAFSNSFDI